MSFLRGLKGKAAEAGRTGRHHGQQTQFRSTEPPMTASGFDRHPRVTTRGMGARVGHGRQLIRGPRHPQRTMPRWHGGKWKSKSCAGCPACRSQRRRCRDFTEAGKPARSLTTFESSPAPRNMAEGRAETIDHGGVLLVEAGTGTGKTLGISCRHPDGSASDRRHEDLRSRLLQRPRRAARPLTCHSRRTNEGPGNDSACTGSSHSAGSKERDACSVGGSAAQEFLRLSTNVERTGLAARRSQTFEDRRSGRDRQTSENCYGKECPRYTDAW